MISKIELNTLEFEGAVPGSGNAILTLTVANHGIVRVNQHLYGVRRNARRAWTWTYGFSGKKLTPSLPSLTALDILNDLLKTSDDKTKQKLSFPPAWSDLTLELTFTDLPRNAPIPQIKNLVLEFKIDWLAAEPGQMVLDVRCDDPSVSVAVNPADQGGRGDGLGDFQRIYGKGAKVALIASPSKGFRVKGWEVNGKPAQGLSLPVDLKVDTQVSVITEPFAVLRRVQ